MALVLLLLLLLLLVLIAVVIVLAGVVVVVVVAGVLQGGVLILFVQLLRLLVLHSPGRDRKEGDINIYFNMMKNKKYFKKQLLQKCHFGAFRTSN